jgi:MFS family permease
MTPIALPFAVLDDLHGNASDVGLVLALGSLAQVGMQLFAGALADRGSRKRQMVGADLLATVAQGTLAALVISGLGNVPVAIALNVFCGISFALHFPAGVGLVPLVVARERSVPAAKQHLRGARLQRVRYFLAPAFAGVKRHDVGKRGVGHSREQAGDENSDQLLH